MRKHVGWCLSGFPVGGAYRCRQAQVSTLPEHDPTVALPPGAQRLPRGHSSEPHPVHLPDRWLNTADDSSPPSGADAFFRDLRLLTHW